MIQPRLEILGPERLKTFLTLKEWKREGVLGGGTAIALQLKHRYSYDFDIFFKKPIVKKYFNKAKTIFNIKKKLVDTIDQLTFLTKDEVKITFLYYNFLPLHPKIKTNSLPLFNLKDLASDKAATIGRRGMWRDYFDLFILLKSGAVSFETLLGETAKRFGVDFSEKLFLEQLVYYGDIANFNIDFISKEYKPDEIQRFFKKITSNYIKSKIF
ncbi:MAG: nucleotidyl transferase AbiEii/AbiGii toxin family protein [Candidatus Brennerbacteria bacterium]|nr:nucleotidyl transferase AbiEii/AbiGii toxin family protein [Candidatus Brennerbacteria bacterium]